MLRRLLPTLLFPLLLIAQQGAFVHSLQHLPGMAGAPVTQGDRHAPGDPFCEKCFEFAQLGASVDFPVALAEPVRFAFDSIGFRLPVALFRWTQAPRNRGPPRLS